MMTDLVLRRHVLVHPGCTSSMIACWRVQPGSVPVALTGRVHLEAGVVIGTGGRVIPRLQIGLGSVLGAGAVEL